MLWQGRVVYNAITVNFEFAQKAWEPSSKKIGGQAVSGAGVPEGFTRRRDELCTLTIVYYEHEWVSIRAWLVWAQDHQAAFAFRFDQSDPTTEYTVYLEAPQDEIKGKPSGEYPGMKEIEVVVRSTTATPFVVARYGT
jgi:hypothetical protein